jgi:hypothetical protein
MSYSKQRLAELFKCIYDHTTDALKDIEKCRNFKLLGGAGTIIKFTNERGTFTGKVPDDAGKTLRIFDEGVDAIGLFVEELHKDEDIKTYVSSKGIEKQVEDALRLNYGKIDCDNIGVFIKESIIKPIRNNIRIWEVYVPVVNLKVEKEIVLGDVSFLPKDITSKTINEFMSKGNYRFYGETEEKKEDNRKAFLGQISKILDGYLAFARVKCKSHSSNIESVATNKAFMAINAVRAFLHILCPPSNKKALWGLPQEITPGLSGIISLNYSEKRSFNLNYVKRGPIITFVLGSSNIEKLQSICHLETIQKILAKADGRRTCLENVAIAALQAIGKAIVAPTTDMRFIGYIMAIERLLIRDGEESTIDKFTDRLVLALTDDHNKRMQLVKRSRELYNKRSKMVHAASFFNIFEDDEFDVENWALNLAIMALGKCKEGYTHQKLCDEINRKKYSG